MLRKTKKIALWAFLVLFVVSSMAGLGGYIFLRSSLPKISGDITLDGPLADVIIARDERGLVYITANSREDGAFALGYAHAQDRLVQMEFIRRFAMGRLSEVVGKATVANDKLALTLGFAEKAKENYDNLDPTTKGLIDSYAKGVNAYLANHQGAWPAAFYILGIEPQPWQGWHSLMYGQLFSLQLSGNWRAELQTMELLKVVPREDLKTLFPDLEVRSPTTAEVNLYNDLPAANILAALPESVFPPGASNIWAVSGKGTQNGAALLANDPHLFFQTPNIWYLAHITTPEGTLFGATVPSIPFVLIGSNGQGAWGFTTTHSDTQDLVLEKVDTEDPKRYLTPDGSLPFEVVEKTIPIKGSEPQILRVRKTRFGPVVSDLQDEMGHTLGGPGIVLSLAWPALTEKDTTPTALQMLNTARSPKDFEEALSLWITPQQNVFFADTKGNIAFVAPAKVPIRIGFDGSTPVIGWTRERLWSGFIPFSELPRSHNPEKGYLVNANNRIVGPDYPYQIATRWQEPYRAERIEHILAQNNPHGLLEAISLQMDIFSPAAQKLLPLFLDTVNAVSPAEKDVVASLKDWDQLMSQDKAAPLLFTAWLREANRAIFADELGIAYDSFAYWTPQAIERVLTQDERWCDVITTTRIETCEDAVTLALREAISLLEVKKHDASDNLVWGDLHTIDFSHIVYGNIPLVKGLLDRHVKSSGSFDTVHRSTPVFLNEAKLFQSVHGAGLRVVFDMAQPSFSHFSITMGQSGNPFSPYYDNLLASWSKGLQTSFEPSTQDKKSTLVLRPR